MAVRILLEKSARSQFWFALACQGATLAALVVFTLIIVWTAELMR